MKKKLNKRKQINYKEIKMFNINQLECSETKFVNQLIANKICTKEVSNCRSRKSSHSLENSKMIHGNYPTSLANTHRNLEHKRKRDTHAEQNKWFSR